MDVDAGLLERCAYAFLVGDDEPEVPRLVRRLGSPCRERDELIAHVDEGHRGASPAAQLELEEASIPGKRLLDVADFERNVIDPDERFAHPASRAMRHGTEPTLKEAIQSYVLGQGLNRSVRLLNRPSTGRHRFMAST